MKNLFWALLVGLFCFTLTYKIAKFNPKEYIQATYYTYTCQGPMCDVQLSSSIGEESYYVDLYNLIETALAGQTIRIHLSGNGGQMSTVYHLANAIKQSKAEIDTIVEGPVYSAHAFIAMLGMKITIYPYSQFLFHLPAMKPTKDGDAVLPNQYCLLYTGHFDRGQDAVKKCMDMVNGEQTMFDQMFKIHEAPFLTDKEKADVYAGYDVYISGSEMQKRIPH